MEFERHRESPTITPVIEKVTTERKVIVESPESPVPMEETITVTRIERRFDTDFGEPVTSHREFADAAHHGVVTHTLNQLAEGLVEYEEGMAPRHEGGWPLQNVVENNPAENAEPENENSLNAGVQNGRVEVREPRNNRDTSVCPWALVIGSVLVVTLAVGVIWVWGRY